MNDLIFLIRKIQKENPHLPYSVYSSHKEQRLFNVPIVKPLLIFVLDGVKNIGNTSETVCNVNNFIFLSNSPTVDMRNIPGQREYFAVLIEFEYQDFDIFKSKPKSQTSHVIGTVDDGLEKLLRQFVEWSLFAPPALWSFRRQEMLQYLYHLGHHQVSSMFEAPTLTQKLHTIFSENIAEEINTSVLCEKLAMSESTLRRKLSAENTHLQEIKDQIKLGHGLHLLQTTDTPIGHIASECGYQSQSRFTERFKQRFGLTPTALRNTRLNELG